MNIAIIGPGRMGRVLGQKWRKNHNVTYGVRDETSEKYRDLDESGFSIEKINNSVEKSDVIVIAVPTSEVENMVRQAKSLKDKIIIDVTNPFSSPVPPGFASNAEAIASWTGSNKVVKTLNQTGSGNIMNPVYGSLSLNTLVCGDDSKIKDQVNKLIQDLGIQAIDAGDLKSASFLESLGNLWIKLAFQQGLGTDVSFTLLNRKQIG